MAFPRIEGYVVTEKLGSGSYSTVYKAYNKVGGRQTVAIKCVEKSRVKHSGSAVDNLITEIRLLKKLSHPHIVGMHHFTWDDKNIYIIMEYCSGGDLSRYIKRYGRVPEPKVRYFLQQLASALKYLHENGVVHMDLKPHNLLLQKETDGRLTLKVADFGFAQHLVSESTGLRGSPLYMAPEVIAGRAAATADLWSVGVIMYECLFGAAPYSSSTLQELLLKIHRRDEIRLPPRAGIPPLCADLLRSLLQHEPARRLSYRQFFEHEYLDLEHMPSAENYEKAVALVREAVSLDASGARSSALRAYTAALRHLVPRAAAEPDPLRRAALRDKLARYMERAEELKRFLAGQEAALAGNEAALAGNEAALAGNEAALAGNEAALAGNEAALSSGEAAQVCGEAALDNIAGQEAALAYNKSALVNNEAALVNNEAALVNNEAALVNNEAALVNNEAALVNNEAALVNKEAALARKPEPLPQASAASTTKTETQQPPARRGALRRLLWRQLPALDDKEHTRSSETRQETQKENEDACRIS